MAEKISIKRKAPHYINDLILKQRVKLLAPDYNNRAEFIAVLDLHRGFVFANNSLLNTFQYSFLELKDKRFSDIFQSINKPNEIDKKLDLAERSSWNGEVICHKNDKNTFNTKLKISPLRDSSDTIRGYELIATNQQIARPNYKKLFEFLLKLEKSYHSFPDLLIIVDENRHIVKFKYFDVESDYFVLNPENFTKLEDLLPKHIVGEINLAINKIKSGPKIIYHEFPLIISNNEKIFEARITRISRHQFSINLRDITKIKLEKREIKKTDENINAGSDKKSVDKTEMKEMNSLDENIQSEPIKTKGGQLLSLEECYTPVVDENNKVIGFIAIDKEVINDKQPEAKSLYSDKSFKAVWEKSFDGMRLTDSQGKIIAVNSAFCKMFDLNEAQLLGKPFTIVYELNQVDNERKMNKYKNNFESRNYEFQRYSKYILHNGISLFIFVNYSFIEIPGAEPLVLGIFRDITDIRKTQEELNRVEKLAAIGKMSSFLSHEIKNPLASIKNYVDLLLNNSEMPANTKPILNILRDSLGNLSKLLSNVLLFSSNIKLIKIDINIYDLVEKVRELLNHKISKKNIQLSNNLSINVIRGDYVSLQSVFFNLLDNAIDAVPRGGKIEINDSVSGGNYLVQIIDNGGGINSPEKIFEAFHSEKNGGTGLGLAIAKKIMEMHEGNINLIDSKPGKTIFELQFPAYGIG